MPHRSHLPFLVLFSILASSVSYAGPHPVPVNEHTNFLECHGDYAKGDHVHSAVKQGCTACHSIEARGQETDVRLKQTDTVVCRQCHEPEKLLHAHFPYASEMCLRCHNPHASSDPRLLRDKVNVLCLACHLRNPSRPPSRDLPTITLTVNNSMGHPYERHPVSGTRDPLTGNEMSCTSCHLAHGGTMPHYLKMAAEIPEDALNQNTETKDMCHECHLRLWGLDSAVIKKKKKSK